MTFTLVDMGLALAAGLTFGYALGLKHISPALDSTNKSLGHVVDVMRNNNRILEAFVNRTHD